MANLRRTVTETEYEVWAYFIDHPEDNYLTTSFELLSDARDYRDLLANNSSTSFDGRAMGYKVVRYRQIRNVVE